MKSLKVLTADEWKEFFIFVETCPNAKPTRGGSNCLIDGVYAYCSPYGCPRKNGRP